jgi:ribose 5-phosphate isomerase B
LKKTIAIGCDHAGYELKHQLIKYLKLRDWKILDFGTCSVESVDYPDFVHPVAKSVEKGDSELGMVICGSGNGVAMTANKHTNIRAALCWNIKIAELARQHNDANIIAIPARFVSPQLAKRMLGAFLKTNFEGGRHQRRVIKISSC